MAKVSLENIEATWILKVTNSAVQQKNEIK